MRKLHEKQVILDCDWEAGPPVVEPLGTGNLLEMLWGQDDGGGRGKDTGGSAKAPKGWCQRGCVGAGAVGEEGKGVQVSPRIESGRCAVGRWGWRGRGMG